MTRNQKPETRNGRSSVPVRTWRPMVLWSAGIVLALGLVWFAAAVVWPVWLTRKVVLAYSGPDAYVMLAGYHDDAVARLGGQELAAKRLALYLRLAPAVAPHKVVALRLLRECGPWGMAPLTSALRSDRPALQRSAASLLAEYGSQAGSAAPDLLRLVRMGPESANQNSPSEEEIADIREVFGSRRDLFRRPQDTPPDPPHPYGPRDEVAFLALATLGPDAAPAMAALVDSPKFRAAAAFWLSRQGETAVPLLEGWLRAPDERARLVAMDALDRLGKGADQVFAVAIKDSSAKMRRKALALFRNSERPPAAVAEAAAALVGSDPDEEVRRFAVELLPEAPAPFARALSDRAPQVRIHAAVRLSRLGNLSAEFVPVLRAALRDEEPAVRSRAASALGRLGPQAAGVVAELAALLKVHDAKPISVPYLEYQPSDLYADPFLESLADRSGFFTLGVFRYGGGRVLPSSRQAAATALGEIGPAAAQAIPDIEPLLEDQDPKVRAAVAEALRKIRGEQAK
jgi:hypothetical protein